MASESMMRSSMTGMINVRDYGASGDGIKDDYCAIQKALTEAAKFHRVVYIPAGRYLHSVGLRIMDNDVGIVGEGGTLLEYTGNGIGFDADTSGPYLTGLHITTLHLKSTRPRATTLRW